MIKQNKTKLTLILSSLFFACVLIASCNNNAESGKAETKDTAAPAPVAPEVKKDTPAAVIDTGAIKGNTKPTPEKP